MDKNLVGNRSEKLRKCRKMKADFEKFIFQRDAIRTCLISNKNSRKCRITKPKKYNNKHSCQTRGQQH